MGASVKATGVRFGLRPERLVQRLHARNPEEWREVPGSWVSLLRDPARMTYGLLRFRRRLGNGAGVFYSPGALSRAASRVASRAALCLRRFSSQITAAGSTVSEAMRQATSPRLASLPKLTSARLRDRSSAL